MNLRSLCPAFMFPILQRAAALPDIFLFSFFKLTTKPDPKGVLTVSPSRDELSGNHAFIIKELEGSEFKVSHLFECDCKNRIKRLKALAQNGIILLDDYTKFIYPLTFPKTTKVIQVWHSTGAFKRMGFARMGRRGSTVATSLTHRNYTHVIVSSKGVTENFCEAFGLSSDKIYPIGVPRTDLFFPKKKSKKYAILFTVNTPLSKTKSLYFLLPHSGVIPVKRHTILTSGLI